MPIKQPTRTYAETRAALRNPRGYLPGTKHEETASSKRAEEDGPTSTESSEDDREEAAAGTSTVMVDTARAASGHSTEAGVDVLAPEPATRTPEEPPRPQAALADGTAGPAPSPRSVTAAAEKPVPRRRSSKERRRVDIRLPVPVDGVSTKLDVARAAHGDSKALLALLRRAWAELEADLLADRVETPPEPYRSADHTVRTTRMIDADAYEKGREIFDPHSVETDTGLAMRLGIAAVARYLARHS